MNKPKQEAKPKKRKVRLNRTQQRVIAATEALIAELQNAEKQLAKTNTAARK